jgi:hypothetical protein
MRCLYGKAAKPVCEYPPDNCVPCHPKHAIDSTPLDRYLEAADDSERNGDPWERDDFDELLEQAFERAASQQQEAA